MKAACSSPLLASALLLLLVAVAGAAETDSIVQPWPARRPSRDAGFEAHVEAVLKTLTLRQKIGQMTQPEIRTITPDEVREYAIGTIQSGGGSWPGDDRAATPAQWRALSEQFQAAALQATPGIPLIWGADAVHGHNNVRGATLFPHNIGLGATRDADLVRDIGRATARAVRAPACSGPLRRRWPSCRTYAGAVPTRASAPIRRSCEVLAGPRSKACKRA